MKKSHFILTLLLPSFLFSQNLWHTWEIVNETSDTIYNRIEAFSHHKAIVVGNNGVIKTTEDGGENWKNLSRSYLGDLKYLEMYNDTFIIAGNEYHLHLTKDFGQSWKPFYDDEKGRIMGSFVARDDEKIIWATVFGRGELRVASFTNGQEWLTLDQGNLELNDSDLVHYYVEVEHPDTLQIFFDRHGNVNAYSNRGPYSKVKLFKIDGKITSIQLTSYGRSPGTTEEILILTDSNECFFSRSSTMDEYVTDSILAGAHMRYEGIAGKDSSFVLLVGKNGKTVARHAYFAFRDPYSTRVLKRATTQDLKWADAAPEHERVGFGSPVVFTFFSISDNQILRMRYNWKPKDIHIERKLVKNLSLYPNPSLHEATLEFELLESAKTRLDLYSQTGVLVQTVFWGELAPGLHQQELPSGLPNGIYFIRLRTGATQATRKWLVE